MLLQLLRITNVYHTGFYTADVVPVPLVVYGSNVDTLGERGVDGT
jgi:hypothetical protein